ncbi:MAG: non-heme iron oxygenase ferredoxin subunit [Planctomycetes bacterium]|nr:non-heme iron oxygenase ferredoxin subunit [Planctomycetota bacterium]
MALRAIWTRVAREAEVPPGCAKLVMAGTREIALFNIGGALHALANVCPHAGGPLGEGKFDGREVECPWHYWSFDVATGHCTTFPDVEARCFPVKIEGGDIFCEIPVKD